mgnify:CR=1 FL=1
MWYFFRHGQTIHNIYKVSQGRYNSSLSLKGIDQAKFCAYKIQDLEENLQEYIFLTSPMFRAKQTINIIMELLNIDPFNYLKEEELLNDINFGDHNNVSNKIVWANYVEDNNILYCQHKNGECFNDVYNRIELFLHKYKDIDNLIFATHGCCFAILKHILMGNKRSDFIRNNLIQNQNYLIKYDNNSKILELI